jgi:phosphohistidine phosphatase SixA
VRVRRSRRSRLRRPRRRRSRPRRLHLPAAGLAVLVLASGCGGDDDDDGAGDAPAARAPDVPVESLRDGGYVVVFRHAATDSGMDTTDDLSDCSRQRNLNGEGRRQSREIGRAFERLDIPVGPVLASPFCRTRDTARIAFGRVQPSRALLSVEFFASPREARRRGLTRLLKAEPPDGANTVLVSHGSAIFEAMEREPEEGDAVIVDPGRGKRGFALMAAVAAGDWGRLEP